MPTAFLNDLGYLPQNSKREPRHLSERLPKRSSRHCPHIDERYGQVTRRGLPHAQRTEARVPNRRCLQSSAQPVDLCRSRALANRS